MNRFLLDTHILLWSLLNPNLLSKKARKELGNSNNEIWLSPITTWEVIVLAEKGHIELDDKPIAWMKSVLQTLPFKQAPINHEVAMKSRTIQLAHQDPVDRFIVGTAMVYDLTLVTADEILIQEATFISIFPARK